MIKITIATTKVDSSFVADYTGLEIGDTAYYVIRESGKRLSSYFKTEKQAVIAAWWMVKKYGLTLVEPW